MREGDLRAAVRERVQQRDAVTHGPMEDDLNEGRERLQQGIAGAKAQDVPVHTGTRMGRDIHSALLNTLSENERDFPESEGESESF
jgi:hypothetical protein